MISVISTRKKVAPLLWSNRKRAVKTDSGWKWKVFLPFDAEKKIVYWMAIEK